MSGSTLDNNSNRPQAKLAIAPKQKALAENLDRHFDFIVCGAGASGSVIAGRLAANPDVKVLLLEAGDSDELELVMDPTLWVRTIGSELDWGFVAARNSQLNGRAIPYSMGKVLGGGSSVNVSTWLRGHQADWDAYAAETGDPAWGYESVLNLYRRRIEDWKGSPDPDYRGSSGPMHVQPAPDLHPFFSAALEAAESTGLKRFENPNGRMMEADSGCAVVDEIVKDGGRQSVFRSYAHPRVGQANLTVLTRALVTRIVFKGNRAAGVEEFFTRASSLRSKRHWRSSFLLAPSKPRSCSCNPALAIGTNSRSSAFPSWSTCLEWDATCTITSRWELFGTLRKSRCRARPEVKRSVSGRQIRRWTRQTSTFTRAADRPSHLRTRVGSGLLHLHGRCPLACGRPVGAPFALPVRTRPIPSIFRRIIWQTRMTWRT